MKITNEKGAKVVVVGMYSGLVVGFLSFIGLGAVPGLLYGGYIGLIMAGSIFGTPVEPTLISRFITGGGMALGALMALTFFLVVGSCLGTVTGLAVAAVQNAGAKSAAALDDNKEKQKVR